MKLSPLEIKKQEFAKAFRGYDVEEVQAFLQMMSSQWETLLEENRRLKEEVRDYQNKIEHYEKVEEALQNALESARQTAKEKIDNAEQKAANLVQEAEQKAEKIREEAHQDRYTMKREVSKLKHRREEIVARLRAFLMSEMEMLAQYEEEDPIGFIKFLPQDEEGAVDEERLQEAVESMPRPKELGGGLAEAPEGSGPSEGGESFDDEGEGSDVEPREETVASPSASSPGQVSERQEAASAAEEFETPEEDEPSSEQKQRWRVHSVVSSPPDAKDSSRRPEREKEQDTSESSAGESAQQQPRQQQEEADSSEEMEKIRRILDDLE